MKQKPIAAFNIHKEIPLAYRFFASVIYIAQTFFTNSGLLENLRKKNVYFINKALKRKLAKSGLTQGQVIEVDRRQNLSEEEYVKTRQRGGGVYANLNLGI